jgi:Lon protease-like protein
MSRYLPVFPLGNPVLPTQILPLHVFEQRYRVLMETLTGFGSPAEMGVVLIERGREVGGGESRLSVGTVTHLIESEQLPDGRWMAIFAGSHPFRVERWLEDDPYPQAIVEERADEEWVPVHAPLLDAAGQSVRQALHLARELGEPVGHPAFAVSDDPAVASWELCARAPLGALDRQSLLEAGSRSERLELLDRLDGHPPPGSATTASAPGGRAAAGGSKGLASHLNELVSLVIAYARQETVDPLKHLGRYVMWGVMGAVLLAAGWGLLALTAVRLIQAETGDHLHGDLTWVPYLGGIFVAAAVAAWAAMGMMRGERRMKVHRP